jgi:hypothetical protein
LVYVSTPASTGAKLPLFGMIPRNRCISLPMDRLFQTRHEHVVGVAVGGEQLVLLHFAGRLGRFRVAQGHEAEGLPPAIGLVGEFALFVGIG